MKNSHLSPLRGEESSITSATLADVSPDEVVATHDRFAAVGPKTDSYGFIHRNISTGPPDRRFNLNDQIEVDLEVVSEEPGTAAQTDENIVLPRRLGGWQFRPLLYWLAAFFVIAGLVPAASQSDSQQASKLVGTGAVGPAEQGWSVALSADGNTAIVGGIVDNRLSRGGVGLHAQRRRLDPAGQQTGRRRRGWSKPDKACPSRCPPTATPPSWAGLTTTRTPGRRGSSRATAASGPSRETSWSAPARSETLQQGVSVALSADGNTAIVGGTRRQLGHRGGVGLHPQRRCLDPTRRQAGRHGAVGIAVTRSLRRAVGRRQHRHRGRALRQREHRGGVGLHPQRRRLDPAGQQTGRRRRGWTTPDKASPSRCPPTATLPSWAGLSTTPTPGRRGSYTRSGGVWTQQGNKLVGTGAVGIARQGQSVALSADGNTAIVGGPCDNSDTGAAWVFTRAGASGPSRAASWSAPARLDAPDKAAPLRCPPTATPPSWAGLPTTGSPGRRGSTPAAVVSGPQLPPRPWDSERHSCRSASKWGRGRAGFRAG